MLFDVLVRNFVEYQCIPVSLGLGHSSVADKSAAVAYAAFIEAGDGLNTWCDSVLSVTTDMGVEMGMSSFNCATAESLLPKWLQASQMQHIDDDSLHAAGL